MFFHHVCAHSFSIHNLSCRWWEVNHLAFGVSQLYEEELWRYTAPFTTFVAQYNIHTQFMCSVRLGFNLAKAATLTTNATPWRWRMEIMVYSHWMKGHGYRVSHLFCAELVMEQCNSNQRTHKVYHSDVFSRCGANKLATLHSKYIM